MNDVLMIFFWSVRLKIMNDELLFLLNLETNKESINKMFFRCIKFYSHNSLNVINKSCLYSVYTKTSHQLSFLNSIFTNLLFCVNVVRFLIWAKTITNNYGLPRWYRCNSNNVEFEVRNEKNLRNLKNWSSFSIRYLVDPAITLSASRLILRYVLLNEQTLNSVFEIINYIW